MVIGFTTTCAISACHLLHCEFESRYRPGVINTTLCYKVCQWLAAGLWFFPGTPDLLQWKWQPQYNWNIVESGIIHHNLNPNSIIDINFACIHCWLIINLIKNNSFRNWKLTQKKRRRKRPVVINVQVYARVSDP